jgi:hypothetical protein
MQADITGGGEHHVRTKDAVESAQIEVSTDKEKEAMAALRDYNTNLDPVRKAFATLQELDLYRIEGNVSEQNMDGAAYCVQPETYRGEALKESKQLERVLPG